MDELDGSELGTKEFWDERYKEEIKNYHTHGDVGEIWFGDDIVDRIINFIESKDLKDKSIVDVGCGNGMLLIELHKCGYKKLKGIDYSAGAIQLAKEIAAKEERDIEYQVLDLLQENDLLRDVDVVCDKGTYDAISLSENAAHNRGIYIENIYKAIVDDGYLIITSCNWTHNELIDQFKYKFTDLYIVPTPQFKFGGKVGSVVSIVVFKKKN